MVIYFKSILEIAGRRKVACRCIKQWNCEKLEIYFKWVSIFIMGYEQNTFVIFMSLRLESAKIPWDLEGH